MPVVLEKLMYESPLRNIQNINNSSEYLDLPLCAEKQEEAELYYSPDVLQGLAVNDVLAELESGVKICSPINGVFTSIVKHSHPFIGKIPCARILIEHNDKTQKLANLFEENEVIISEGFSRSDIIDKAAQAGIFDDFNNMRLVTIFSNTSGNSNVYAVGFDDQPYLFSNGKLLEKYAAKIFEGLRLASIALNTKKTGVIVSSNFNFSAFDRIKLPSSFITAGNTYPAMAKIKTKLKNSNNIFLSVHSLLALYGAVVESVPQTGVVVSVGGSAVRAPRQIYAHFGTNIGAICQLAGVNEEVDRVIAGGVMNGKIISPDSVLMPGITSLTVMKSAFNENEKDCINCGLCVSCCPVKLLPINIMQAYERKDNKKIKKLKADRCIKCGKCGFVCPSFVKIAPFMDYISTKMQNGEI